MSNITINKGDLALGLKTWSFPAGERGVKLDTTDLKYLYGPGFWHVITARLQSPADVMDLLLVKDALDRDTRFTQRLVKTPVHLFLSYCPYGRQDRVCTEGESFSLGVFARLINGAGFERVTIVDPHSEVTSAVINNLTVIDQKTVVGRFDALNRRLFGEGVRFKLVSPDAGANKKTSDLAKYFGHVDFIRADKRRNLATGEIVETVVYADRLDGVEAVVVDDLIDGGKTYIELAKVLKAKGAAKVILYATHGIFSKGTKPLFEAGIDEIFSTNSFYEIWPAGVDGVTTLKLEDVFTI